MFDIASINPLFFCEDCGIMTHRSRTHNRVTSVLTRWCYHDMYSILFYLCCLVLRSVCRGVSCLDHCLPFVCV